MSVPLVNILLVYLQVPGIWGHEPKTVEQGAQDDSDWNKGTCCVEGLQVLMILSVNIFLPETERIDICDLIEGNSQHSFFP